MQKSALIRGTAHVILFAGGLMMLYPLLYALFGAMMDPFEYLRSSSLIPIPSHLNFYKFAEMVTYKDFPYWIRNTLFRITWYLVFMVVTSVVLGYFFAKGTFVGRKVCFYFILSTMMIPSITAMIPSYVMYARWPWTGGNDVFFGGHGLLNSWGVLLLPGLVSVMSLFLTKQMYDTLPGEYEESARMDGASTYRIIFQIYAPMLKPVLAVILITDFNGIWNDFMTNLIYTDNPGRNLTTISYGMTKLPKLLSNIKLQENFVSDYPGIFAAAFMIVLPTITVYLLVQRHIVQGLAMSGLKG
ncbi:carbohydrate ABC transporter permease [Paenibacillus sp. GCM10027626]|uniref:carbohydrate ABC transporter permease n=1 Tax=Paenibacillus sp. GCM10027626 TaxID=3273411 RepID=UPI0036262CA0